MGQGAQLVDGADDDLGAQLADDEADDDLGAQLADDEADDDLGAQLADDEADDDLSGSEVALIRSTYRVIARRGVRRMSLQDVADDAGVSKGLVLYHFKSKDHLLLLTMRWALQATASRIRDAVDATDDPRGAVDALLDAVFVGPERNRDFYLLYLDLVEHAARDRSFNELSTLTERVINGLYREIIEDGVDRGILDVDDVEGTAASMRALIDGTFFAWVQRDDWKATHALHKQRCRSGVLRLLGVG